MDKITAYVQAALKNPEFMKTVAFKYGDGLVTDAHGNHVCNISMNGLATAIHELESELSKLEPA